MSGAGNHNSAIDFGPFRVDAAAGQLHKNGRLVRLPEQPFQVLVALLERPGEVVTREELQEKLWPGQAYGAVDQGLHNAVNKLRDALGDSAANPRYVETLPKRGYKFIYPLPNGDEPQPLLIRIRKMIERHAAVVSATAVATVAITLIIQYALKGPDELPPPPRSDRFSFEVPDLQGVPILEPLVGVSPDGQEVAYVGADGFWLRNLSEPQPRRLEGTKGAGRFVWSPDSTAIAFLNRGAIKRVSIQGGPPTIVWENAAILPGGDIWWSPDGNFIRFKGSPGTIEVPAKGGLPRESPVPLEPQSWGLPRAFSAIEPDWIHVNRFYPHEREIALGGLKREERRVLAKGWSPWYSSGHILFASLGSPRGIWAVPLSQASREPGDPFLVERADVNSISVSNDGTLVYAAEPAEQARLLLLNRKGELVRVAGAQQAGMGRPEFSPDGRRVAVWGFEYETAWDVWIHEVDRPLKTRLTLNEGMDIQPVWSPDGTRIAFTSDRAGSKGPAAARDLYVKAVDRNEEAKLVARDSFVWDWSENGAYLLTWIQQNGNQSLGDIGYIEITGKGPFEVKPLLKTKYKESHAVFSPDGRYVAFISNKTGKPEVYVCSFPVCVEERRVSSKGGAFPRWARKQGSLYYLQDEDTLMEVKVTTQPKLVIGKPEPLFTYPGLALPGARATRYYDVSEDGERFVVVEDGAARISKENPAVIHVWRNWYAKFKDRKDQ